MSSSETEQLFARALDVIPGGINSNRRRIDPPLCVRQASGSRFVDLEGREYIDYHLAYSPIVLGHAYEAVDNAVASAIRQGVLYGVGVTEAEVRLAEKITHHVPAVDKVLLCNSGSEATQHAIRVARAYTGRSHILKFQGAYHGFHDYVLRNILSEPDRVGVRDPGSAGMLDCAVDHTLIARFNDLDSVADVLRGTEGDVAAILVEPIAHNAPAIMPVDGFLAGLRQLCDEHGCLLIFDEVITGFRHSLAGYQAFTDVRPDITTMGKAIGNGFPVAAVGGRREVMDRFNTNDDGDVHYGGTYFGNSVGTAAALATIEVLERPGSYDHLFDLGERMRDGLREITETAGVASVVSGFGSIFMLLFMEGPLISYEDVLRNDAGLFVRYRRNLVSRGIFEMPENIGRSHVTLSHTADEVERTLDIAADALDAALERTG